MTQGRESKRSSRVCATLEKWWPTQSSLTPRTFLTLRFDPVECIPSVGMQGADTPHIEPALTMLWNSDDYSAGFRECLKREDDVPKKYETARSSSQQLNPF